MPGYETTYQMRKVTVMARDEAYQEAEQRIEQARREGATELGLRRMELTELPESLGELTQLQTLDLSGNQLTSLPPSLVRLEKLCARR